MKFIVWFSKDREIVELPSKVCHLGTLASLSTEEWDEEVAPIIQCNYEGDRYEARILQMVPDDSMDTTETVSVLRRSVQEKRLTSHHKLLKLCSRVRPQRRERHVPLNCISSDSETHLTQSETSVEPSRKKSKSEQLNVPQLLPLLEAPPTPAPASEPALNFPQPSPTTSLPTTSQPFPTECISRQKLFSDRSWISARKYVRSCGFEWGSVEGNFRKSKVSKYFWFLKFHHLFIYMCWF